MFQIQRLQRTRLPTVRHSDPVPLSGISLSPGAALPQKDHPAGGEYSRARGTSRPTSSHSSGTSHRLGKPVRTPFYPDRPANKPGSPSGRVLSWQRGGSRRPFRVQLCGCSAAAVAAAEFGLSRIASGSLGHAHTVGSWAAPRPSPGLSRADGCRPPEARVAEDGGRRRSKLTSSGRSLIPRANPAWRGGGFLDWDDMPTPATTASRSPPRRRWTIPRNASASTNCCDTLPFCPSNLSPISRLVLRHSGTIRPDQNQPLSDPPSAAKLFCDSRPGSAHHPSAAKAGPDL